MADQTPPGPTASGRIAGVIALVALVLGGYYAVVARPGLVPGGDAAAPVASAPEAGSTDSQKTADAANTPTKGADAPGAATEAAAPAAKTSDAQTAEAAKSESKDAGAAPASGTAAKSAEAGSTGGGNGQPPASADAKAASGTASGEATGAPSFDVVRVEPTGEAVVAGLAEPKATVEVLDGSSVIGKGEANERGEWAIVVEKPLASGTHDLSIRTTSPDGKTQALSEQRVAIEVPQQGKGEPLVVLNAPNAPSRVIQLPEASKPATPGEQQVAAANPPPKAAEAPDSGSAGANAAVPETAADGSAATPDSSASANAAPGNAEASGKNPVAGGSDAGGVDATAAGNASPKAGTPAEGAKPGEVAVAAPAPAASQDAANPAAAAANDPAKTATADAGTPATPGTEPGRAAAGDAAATAAANPGPANAGATADATASAPAPAPKITVDAVEFEDGTIYVAGSGAIGGTVRIYVDGVPVGDAQAGEGGRWLLETKHDMKPGQHTVRADQVNKATGDVIVRAEVPFEQTVDVAVLAPVTAGGGGSEGASGSGSLPSPQNVIIRRGDNLWTISRRLYGKGVRFSTIYEANSDQIRNPHWIYPGQIFVLPAGDTRWTN